MAITNSSVRLDRALYLLAAILVVIAIAAAVRPPTVPDASVPPAVGAAATSVQPAEPMDPATATAIVEANIFSDTRTPPAERYDPFQPAVQDETAVMDPFMIEETVEQVAEPRLFGTVFGPDGPRALMELDPDLPQAQLYKEGDRVGRFVVVKINEQSVILDTSNGRIVLQLFRSDTLPDTSRTRLP